MLPSKWPLFCTSFNCLSKSLSSACCFPIRSSRSVSTALAAVFVRSTSPHTVSSLYTLPTKETLYGLCPFSDFLRGEKKDPPVAPGYDALDSSQIMTSLRASRDALRSSESALREMVKRSIGEEVEEEKESKGKVGEEEKGGE